MLLASVNFFVATTSGYQISRIIQYRKEQGDSASQIISYLFNGPSDKQKTEEQKAIEAAAPVAIVK